MIDLVLVQVQIEQIYDYQQINRRQSKKIIEEGAIKKQLQEPDIQVGTEIGLYTSNILIIRPCPKLDWKYFCSNKVTK